MKKVLIANRGEIAVRIIRTLKEMNITSVAVYSSGDKDSLHVALADEAYCIGGPSSADSYLNIDNILQAALMSGADAIHPGYGFLSETPEFARRTEELGKIFIGPTAETMEKMGNKSMARQTMEKAGVPVIPGSDGIVNSIEEVKTLAANITYPVVIKAVSGGGGKGMRFAHSDEDVDKLYAEAKKKRKALLMMIVSMSRNIFQKPGILKFRLSVTDMEVPFIYMNVTVRFKEITRSCWKKHQRLF